LQLKALFQLVVFDCLGTFQQACWNV